MTKQEISWGDFQKIDLRVGTIKNAEVFHEAIKPAFKLSIDFGELGMLKSSAQITDLYTIDNLEGMQVIAVVNFPLKQIANFMSECLVLGVMQKNGVVLLSPERNCENGMQIG